MANVTCGLDAGVSVGCPAGSACTSDEYGRFCRQNCTGPGATTCRPQYACHENPDFDWNDGPRTCTPLCNSDADCNRLGGTYGCNLWSRRCEQKDKGLAKYGAPCASNAACESGICHPDRGGWCGGLCRKSTNVCATDGVCASEGTNDATGRCFDICNTAAECTRGAPYQCQPPPWGGTTTNVCYCARGGEPCNDDADCCLPGFGPFPACFLSACLQ